MSYVINIPNQQALYGDRDSAKIDGTDEGFWHPIRQSWTSFSGDSTIHGVSHIGRENKHIFSRLMFCVVVLTCAGLCIWNMTTQISQYLTYNVKTATEFVAVDNLSFPAITFCNENIFRKSIVGGSPAFIASVGAFYAASEAGWISYMEDYLPFCYNSTIKNDFTELLDYDNSSWFWNTYGMSGGMYFTSMDSYQSVLECNWLNVPINCTDPLFLNHFTDYGWCFTFNPSESSVASAYNTKFAYGITPKTANPVLSIINSGPKNGFRLIMNVNQDDYCITKDKGVGFRAIIHDPNVQPLFTLENAILLSPGFDTSVAIQVTQITRETESLDRCKAFIPISWYPNATVYYKDACYMGCFTDFIMSTCRCFPTFGPISGYEVYSASHPYVPICYGENMTCMNQGINSFVQGTSPISATCPMCVDPCEELQYSQSMSFEYFPAGTQASVFLQQYNITDLVASRANLLGVNFYVETLQITTITETQDVTLNDLVCALGGLMGLFLGMSIVSIVEVIHQLGMHVKAMKVGLANAKRLRSQQAFQKNLVF